MSHKKFGPDRFSRFDVYWIQTNKQTPKHPDRKAKFIYRYEYLSLQWIVFRNELVYNLRSELVDQENNVSRILRDKHSHTTHWRT